MAYPGRKVHLDHTTAALIVPAPLAPVGPQKEMWSSVVTTGACATQRDMERVREPPGGEQSGCYITCVPEDITTASL
jgi:hypothetical protein